MRTTTALIFVASVAASCSSDPVNNPPTNSDDGELNNMVMNGEPGLEVTFSNLRVEEVGPRRAVVRFETSVPTTCEVEWGSAEDALDNVDTDPSMADGELSETHDVPLEDLEPESTYYWRGRVVDDAGDVWFSDVQNFTTEPEAATNNGIPLQNFAAEASVTDVSSNFGGGDNDSTWGANKAFDGQMGTEWATDGDGDDAMVTVEFGSIRKVTHFAFRSRKMADGTSIVEKVQLRFNGGDPVGPFDTPDPDQRYQFELEMPQAAERVTVEAVETTGGNTGAKEIEFLGTPKE